MVCFGEQIGLEDLRCEFSSGDPSISISLGVSYWVSSPRMYLSSAPSKSCM